MIINLFRSDQIAFAFALPVFAALLWFLPLAGNYGTNLYFPADSGGMPLYAAISGILGMLPVWMLSIVAWILVSFQGIYLNIIINTHEVLYKKSLLPGFFYIVIVSALPSCLSLHPVLFANLILMYVLDRILSLYKSGSPMHGIFDAGFFISIASLIYFPSIFIFPLVIIGLMTLLPFSLRGWIVATIGLCLPYFFTATYYFMVDRLDDFIALFASEIILSQPDLSLHLELPGWIISAWVIFLLAISVLKLLNNFYKNVIRTRNYQQIFLVLLILTGLSFYAADGITVWKLTFLAVPLSVLTGYYFLAVKKAWLTESLFWILAICIIWNHLISS
jgi:hypothetical protein